MERDNARLTNTMPAAGLSQALAMVKLPVMLDRYRNCCAEIQRSGQSITIGVSRQGQSGGEQRISSHVQAHLRAVDQLMHCWSGEATG